MKSQAIVPQLKKENQNKTEKKYMEWIKRILEHKLWERRPVKRLLARDCESLNEAG